MAYCSLTNICKVDFYSDINVLLPEGLLVLLNNCRANLSTLTLLTRTRELLD